MSCTCVLVGMFWRELVSCSDCACKQISLTKLKILATPSLQVNSQWIILATPSFQVNPKFTILAASSFQANPQLTILATSSFQANPQLIILATSSFQVKPQLTIQATSSNLTLNWQSRQHHPSKSTLKWQSWQHHPSKSSLNWHSWQHHPSQPSMHQISKSFTLFTHLLLPYLFSVHFLLMPPTSKLNTLCKMPQSSILNTNSQNHEPLFTLNPQINHTPYSFHTCPLT